MTSDNSVRKPNLDVINLSILIICDQLQRVLFDCVPSIPFSTFISTPKG